MNGWGKSVCVCAAASMQEIKWDGRNVTPTHEPGHNAVDATDTRTHTPISPMLITIIIIILIIIIITIIRIIIIIIIMILRIIIIIIIRI